MIKNLVSHLLTVQNPFSTVMDPGFPRGKAGTPTYFGLFVPNNCMKLKNNAPSVPSDSPMFNNYNIPWGQSPFLNYRDVFSEIF